MEHQRFGMLAIQGTAPESQDCSQRSGVFGWRKEGLDACVVREISNDLPQ